MDRQVADDIEALTASTRTLQRTIADLTDEQVGAPSLLPGWTRGHVLTHLARNADGFLNLLAWARTGVEQPMYVSQESRAADIEAGAHRTAADLIADVEESQDRLAAAIADLDDDEYWRRVVRVGKADRERPAAQIPMIRRVEVEVHHVDLDLDYTLAHLPTDLVTAMLTDITHDLSTRDDLAGFVLVANDDEGTWVVGDGGAEITGTPPSLLGWLLGRTQGIGLHSDEPLPDLGPWR
jgi:maleylpyruvate isomerase